jgi:hypothetical protein
MPWDNCLEAPPPKQKSICTIIVIGRVDVSFAVDALALVEFEGFLGLPPA